MKRMILLLTMMVLVIAAGSVLAGNDLVITPVSGEVQYLTLGSVSSLSAQGDVFCCKLGNDNPAVYAVEDFVTGNQKFSYQFFAEPSCGCETGFFSEKIQITMRFGPEDVPVTLEVNASFEETQFDATGDHLVPGPPICTSPTFSGTIYEPGIYIVEVPLRQVNCLCAHWGYDYAVTMNFLNTFENKPDLIIDANPVGGTSWMSRGDGWEDLVADYRFLGELKMKTKIQCCSNPVDDVQPSWGSLKAQFR